MGTITGGHEGSTICRNTLQLARFSHKRGESKPYFSGGSHLNVVPRYVNGIIFGIV